MGVRCLNIFEDLGLRSLEVKSFNQGHTASKWQNQKCSWGCPVSQFRGQSTRQHCISLQLCSSKLTHWNKSWSPSASFSSCCLLLTIPYFPEAESLSSAAAIAASCLLLLSLISDLQEKKINQRSIKGGKKSSRRDQRDKHKKEPFNWVPTPPLKEKMYQRGPFFREQLKGIIVNGSDFQN